MTRIGKLHQKALQGRTLGFAEFCRLMEAFGYRWRRTTGSHHVYAHPTTGDRRVVQPRGAEAKPYQVEQFLDMVEQHGLTLEDR